MPDEILHIAPTGAEPHPEAAADAAADPGDTLTDEQKRANVLRLAFGNDEAKYQDFCRSIQATVPGCRRVVLRGSAVTGRRWKDGAAVRRRRPRHERPRSHVRRRRASSYST